MSLLDNGAKYEPCEVYLEVTREDRDGNTITQASTTPTPAKARFQFQGQQGTSSRRAEEQSEGFESEKLYTARFPRSFTAKYGILGAQSQIEWDGRRWGIFGDAQRYKSSRRTAHVYYNIRLN